MTSPCTGESGCRVMLTWLTSLLPYKGETFQANCHAAFRCSSTSDSGRLWRIFGFPTSENSPILSIRISHPRKIISVPQQAVVTLALDLRSRKAQRGVFHPWSRNHLPNILIPTRYGNWPAQWKVRIVLYSYSLSFDHAFPHRHPGMPGVSSGPLESSQESTLVCSFQAQAWEAVKNPPLFRWCRLLHHGPIYVPLDYTHTVALWWPNKEVGRNDVYNTIEVTASQMLNLIIDNE